MTILLGLSGYAGAGKDSFADILVANYGFTKLAFADPLREVAAAINPIVAFQTENYYDHGDPEKGELLGYEVHEVRYNDALARHGYNQAKFEYPEVRELLQRIGTEAGRKVISDTLWVDMAMKRAAEHERVVIADMRFRNEAHAVLDNGGFAMRVNRPGVMAANDHISEHDLDSFEFSHIIENDGTVDDLETTAALVAESFWGLV